MCVCESILGDVCVLAHVDNKQSLVLYSDHTCHEFNLHAMNNVIQLAINTITCTECGSTIIIAHA